MDYFAWNKRFRKRIKESILIPKANPTPSTVENNIVHHTMYFFNIYVMLRYSNITYIMILCLLIVFRVIFISLLIICF